MKKILIALWKLAGIAILTWFTFWFVKVRILNQYGMVSDVITLTIATATLIVYVIITGIFLLTKRRKRK
jgi:hypothetical protein